LVVRRIIKIIVVLIVLAALVAVGGTLVLRSAWLGGRVVHAMSTQLGLDVSAESFALTWGGAATLGGVRVRLPPSEDVVFQADRVRLGLDAVPWLVLRRSIRVYTAELDRPTVSVRQTANGGWNVQEVWRRVCANLGPASPPGRRVELPAVAVREAEVRIAASDTALQTVGPLRFDGRPKAPVLWTFALDASDLGRIEGQVVQGGDWTHELDFHVANLGPLIRSFSGRDLAPVRAAGHWRGSVSEKVLRGELELKEGRWAQVALRGGVQVEVTPACIRIGPRALIVSEPNLGGAAVHLAEGAVAISREQIALESLTVRAGALGGRINGRWELAARRGEFSGSWADTSPEASVQPCGTYQFSLASPAAGRKEVQANVVVQARSPVGSWHGVAEISGTGADWLASQWQIKAPLLSWSRGARQVDANQVAARFDLHWPEVRLTSLSVPQAKQASATARFDVSTHRWSAQLAIQGLREPALGARGLDFRVTAEGNDRIARVSELRVATEDSVVTAQGALVFAGRRLQDVHLSADGPDRLGSPAPAGTQPAAGRWHLDTDVTGQILPVAMEAQATLSGRNIALGKRQVEQVRIPLHVSVDARQVEATTEPFELLGGQWQALGRYEFSGQATGVQVLATDLSLAAVAGMAGLPLTSQGQARGEVELRMPGLEIQKAVATGSWSARDVNIPPLRAQRAQGILRIAGGQVRLDHIQLEQDSGLTRGRMEFSLDQPQVISVDLEARDWPVSLEREALTCVLDGQAKLQANIIRKTAAGEGRLRGRIVWKDKDLADLRLSTRVQGQTVEVRELHAETLGGSADGTATIPLSRWTDSVAQLRWQGIEPRQLAAWQPSFGPFQGSLSGSLVVEHAEKGKAGQSEGVSTQAPMPDHLTSEPADHPLGPLRFVLNAAMTNGGFGTARLDTCGLRGYADANRLLIEKATFDALGGRVDLWGRLSRHAARYYGSVVADFNNLSLDQLVHAISPNAGEYAGRLSGHATILPAFDRRISLAGEGRIDLTQSDLANNPVVGTLYNTLSLHFGAQEPTGTGEVRLALEGPAVNLSSIQYFNRGVEVRGSARIENVNLGAASPIEGYAVASTRVLKGVKLPGMRDLDRLLDIFQTGAASVKIGGSLNDVQVKAVPLPEVVGPFRRLLWAQLRR
jgi:hypothetical protein